MVKISKLLSLLVFAFLSITSSCQAEAQPPKKGIARGTFMVQGYSFVGDPGTLRFYAEGAQAAESSLSYVDDAYISLDEGDYQGNPYELKGTFSGGPNGVATFTTYEGLSFSVPLKDGRIFDLSIPGVQVHMVITDPSIFEIDEDDMPAEYDPDAPLTDSGARAANISGQVEIACPPNFDAWDIMKRHTVIYNHCRLKTGEESTLRISFASGTSFTMRPETEIIVNEARKEKSNFQLLFGGIWANVKKMVKGEEFGFKGSQAVAGIKGTTFIMEETGESTTLKVIDGEVEFMDIADGKTQTVIAGEALAVDLRGFGEKTEFDVNIEENNWAMPASVDEAKGDAEKETAPSQTNYLGWLVGIGILFMAVVTGTVIRKRLKA
ncbi:MAG: FecR family protein [Candidatus Omnitrophica bacterium]|nr:FecR family protein [Candidatus Omnitrophota bacterium]